MNKFDGKDFNLFIEGVDVFGASDGTISITSDRLPGGNKGDGGFEGALAGEYGATINIPSLFTSASVAGKVNTTTILGYQKNRTKVTVTFRRSVAPDARISKYFLADAYVSSTSITGNKNEVATVSVVLQVTGAISTLTESS